MPTKRKVLGGLFERETEAPKVQGDAEAKGLTVSNYFRSLAGFEPIKNGPPPGSQNRKGKFKKRRRKMPALSRPG